PLERREQRMQAAARAGIHDHVPHHPRPDDPLSPEMQQVDELGLGGDRRRHERGGPPCYAVEAPSAPTAVSYVRTAMPSPTVLESASRIRLFPLVSANRRLPLPRTTGKT